MALIVPESKLESATGDPLAEERGWLTEYVRNRSAEAFARLVRRYSDLVYSAALRQTRGDRHLAEDVTQAVFLVLATRAARIRPGVVLASWLLVVTRYAAGDALKAQTRRRRREGKAAIAATATAMNPVHVQRSDDAEWNAVASELDTALATLREKDRRAVVLRYLQGQSVEQVAAALGVTPAAAKQRTHRAIERLRTFFHARGISSVSAASIGPLLLKYGVQPTPPHLMQSLVTAPFGTVASAGIISIAKGAVITMAWTKAKALALGAAMALLLAGGTAVAVGTFHRPATRTVVLQNQPPASAPATTNLAEARFEQAYGLEPGQILKFVPEPLTRVRIQYFVTHRMPPTDARILTFDFWNGNLKWRSATWGSDNVWIPIQFCAGLDWYDVDDPHRLLQTSMPGDWVVRQGTPREQVLSAIAGLLSPKLGQSVHFTLHMKVRDVINVTGRFDHSRLKQLPHGALILGTPPSPETWRQPSSGRLRDVLDQFAEEVHIRVIDRAAGADDTVAWYSFNVAQTDVDRQLTDLAAQTGLTFKRETRNVQIWDVSAE